MNKTVGSKLKKARIKKSLSIELIAEETYIRKRFLIALEEGNFSQLPSAAQVRGFLRTYADYLGLDSNELLASLKQALPPPLDSDQEIAPNIIDVPNRKNKTEEMELIFREIGKGIKNRREMLGLSLDDIETHTHIPVNYLQLVESGSLNSFPSPTQARGMLGNYANFLNMDKHAVMLRYAEALQSKLNIDQKLEQIDLPKPKSKSKRKVRLPLWLRNTFSADTIVFGILGFATLVFSIWGIARVLDIQASTEPKPTAPALSALLLPSPTATIQPTVTTSPNEISVPTNSVVQAEDETADPTLQPFTGENIQLYIIVSERTYLRVIVDGESAFDGRVISGTNLPYTANQYIELLTGNAAAIQIIYNDIDFGPLGITGEVVNVIYTRDGVISPTPTISPTLDPEQITPTLTPTIIPTSDIN